MHNILTVNYNEYVIVMSAVNNFRYTPVIEEMYAIVTCASQ